MDIAKRLPCFRAAGRQTRETIIRLSVPRCGFGIASTRADVGEGSIAPKSGCPSQKSRAQAQIPSTRLGNDADDLSTLD